MTYIQTYVMNFPVKIFLFSTWTCKHNGICSILLVGSAAHIARRELDEALEADRFALEKAKHLVQLGKMSEEEFLLMQQKVLDGSEDRILDKEATTGKVGSAASPAFAGYVDVDNSAVWL